MIASELTSSFSLPPTLLTRVLTPTPGTTLLNKVSACVSDVVTFTVPPPEVAMALFAAATAWSLATPAPVSAVSAFVWAVWAAFLAATHSSLKVCVPAAESAAASLAAIARTFAWSAFCSDVSAAVADAAALFAWVPAYSASTISVQFAISAFVFTGKAPWEVWLPMHMYTL